jgi:hypothetical protein
MTGTGTQNDPYIISDWTDFITAVGTSGAYVEFPKNLTRTDDTDVDPNKLYTDEYGVVQTNVQPADLSNLYENTFVLDANSDDGFPGGITTHFQIRCASINGFGGTIINLASSMDGIWGFYAVTQVTGIAFLNINLEERNFFWAVWRGDYNRINKCIFSGRLAASNNAFILTNYLKFTSCAFALELWGLSASLTSNSTNALATFDVSRIQLTKTDTSSNSLVLDVAAKNSYITGSVTAPLRINTPSDYTVIDLEAPQITAMNSSQSNVLANSDKCNNISGYLTSVTTTQLKDAAYLSSIGFPIQT